MTQKINVCVIGSGNMGKIRIDLLCSDLSPQYEIKVLVSERGSKIAKDYGIKRFDRLEDVDEAILDSCDAFIVCSRTSVHSEHLNEINTLTRNRKTFVFIEKPVAASPEEIDQIFDNCENSNTVLCCGFQRRFDDSYLALKKVVEGNQIGKPNFVRVFFADHPVPNLNFLLQEGCPFMDLTPHDIDFVRHCLNDEVESVSAQGSSTLKELKEGGVLDNISVTLKFKKGCIVNLFCSRSCAYGYDQRCEFFGSKGRAEVENIRQHEVKVFNSSGQTTGLLSHSYPQRFRDAFKKELEVFAQVCTNNNNVKWPVTKEDCAQVQKVAAAAARACRESKEIRIE